MGLFGMVVSPDYGGHGMDYLAYIIAVEEVARIDGSQAATVAAHNSLGIGPLYQFGTEEQKKKVPARPVYRGSIVGLRITEAEAGSDSRGTKTTAVLENGE